MKKGLFSGKRLALAFIVVSLSFAAVVSSGALAFARFVLFDEAPSDTPVVVGERYVRVYGEGPYDAHDGWGPYYLRYVGSEEVVDVAADMDERGCILDTEVTSAYKLFENPNQNLQRVILPDVSMLEADGGLSENLFGDGIGDRSMDVVYRDGVRTSEEGSGPHAARDLTGQAFAGTSHAATYLLLEPAHLEKDGEREVYRGDVPHIYVSNEVDDISSLFKMNTSLQGVLFDPDPNPNWTSMSADGLVGTFYCCTGLESLPANFSIPSTVVNMGNAFCGCSNLAALPDSFTFPAGVTNLSRTFQLCRSLTHLPDGLVVPQSVTGEGLYCTFSGCESLEGLPKGVRVPSGVTNIGGLFKSCKRLVLPDDFAIPSTVASANQVFASCEALVELPSSLRLPEALTSLQGMFSGCTSLKRLPEGFDIPDGAVNATMIFYGCRALDALPAGFSLDSATFVDEAFRFCTSLAALPDGFALPADVEAAHMVFQGCTSLRFLPQGFTLPATMRDATKLFAGCTSLESLPEGFEFPEKLVVMNGLFKDCSSLSGEIMLRDTVKSLEGCFDGAGAVAGGYDEEGEKAAGGKYAIVVRYNYNASDYVKGFAAENTNARVLFKAILPAWEKVYEAGAPYADDVGSFYLHYVGQGDAFGLVDVQEEMDKDAKTGAGLGRTLLGVEVTSTYKMFDKVSDSVATVVLPDVSLLGHATLGGVSPLLFGEDVVVNRPLDVAYRDGMGQAAPYEPSDLTSALAFDAAPQTTVYLYLEPTHLTQHQNATTYELYRSYDGLVPHLLVSRDVASISNIASKNTAVTLVLFDPRGNESWTALGSNLAQLGAFDGCSRLVLPDNFKIPETVVSLYNAFYGCSSITRIPPLFKIPDGVYDMQQAFQNCKGLTSLPDDFAIPERVTNLNQAFDSCSYLQKLPDSFKLPDGATDLSYMFRYCIRLESLSRDFAIPSKAQTLHGMFFSCRALTALPDSLRLPACDGLDAGYLFKECNSVKRLPAQLIPDGADILLDQAFAEMESLEKLPSNFIGNGITQLVETFASCSALSSLPVDLLARAESLSTMDHTFYNCKGLATLPEGMFVGHGKLETLDSIFSSCTALADVPEALFEGTPNVKSMRSAFSNCTFESLPKGILPETVVDAAGMFAGCKNLVSSPDLPDSIEDLTDMFMNCWLFSEPPKLPANARVLDGMFAYCKALRTAPALPGKVESMNKMFYNCTTLSTFESDFRVPGSMRSMSQAFSGCANITALPEGFILPEGVTTIEDLFYGCGKLDHVPEGFTVPASVTTMEGCFGNCRMLKSLPSTFRLNEGLENMDDAFYSAGVTAFPEGFTIPSTVRKMYRTFEYASVVRFPESFRLPEGLASMSGTFEYMSSLESFPEGMTIPESVTSMSSTFLYDRKLSGVVTLPRGLKSLGSDTFKETGLNAPKNYDAQGNRVADGTGEYSFVLRYYPSCTAAANYVASKGTLKLAIEETPAAFSDAVALGVAAGMSEEPSNPDSLAAGGDLAAEAPEPGGGGDGGSLAGEPPVQSGPEGNEEKQPAKDAPLFEQEGCGQSPPTEESDEGDSKLALVPFDGLQDVRDAGPIASVPLYLVWRRRRRSAPARSPHSVSRRKSESSANGRNDS